MKPSRIAITTGLALCLAMVFASNSSAQTLKRHALIEEGTGTWCHACPFGAWTIDSMEKYMGIANVVAISWHGPNGYGEPMYTKQIDTVLTYNGANGYPWAIIGRIPYSPNGSYSSYPNPWSQTAQMMAAQPALVDFRIVNAYYHSNSVDFDIDITPFNLSTMPAEDSVSYGIVAVLTEDGIVSSQQEDPPGGGATFTDDNFVHHNVARAVGGKVMGDVVSLGTKTPVMWPVRKHYHMAAKGTTLGIDWMSDSLKIKAFVVRQSKKGNGQEYLDANQTGYVTKLPTTAAKAVWAILPRTNDNFPGDSTRIPIVWNKGGGAGATIKLDYSIDAGVTWTNIASGVTTTTYEWKIADTAFGHNVTIKVTDGTDATLNSISGSFSIQPKPYFAVSDPKANDIAYVNSTFAVNFAGTGTGENIGIELSRDSQKTWAKLGAVTGGASTYSWHVTGPVTTTASAFIRISDGLGAIGISAAFSIYDSGMISEVTDVDGARVNVGPSIVNWVATGYLGETIDVDVSYDNKQSWSEVKHGLPSSATTTTWNVPVAEMNKTAVLRVMASSGATGYSSPFTIGEASVAEGDSPAAMRLSPNPFSFKSTISYSLTEPAVVTFIVHDLLGREVARTGIGTIGAGPHSMTFDGSMLAAGAYEYVLLAGHESYRGKLSIVR